MRVAILGGGFLAVCTALELARRGVRVQVFDRGSGLLQQAATRNEGKIHLGYVYANTDFRTAEKMIFGALRFLPLLRRWIGDEADRIPVSDEFIYAVHRDSILPFAAIQAHANRVSTWIDRDGGLSDYPGRPSGSRCSALSKTEIGRHFDTGLITAAIRTPERAIRVDQVAEVLRQVVAAERLITVNLHSEVVGASTDGNKDVVIRVHQGDHIETERFDHVVNALWDGRLRLDATLGMRPDRQWLWRMKYAITCRLTRNSCAVPSFTVVLGPFGDVVNFGAGRLYLSWYPACLDGLSHEISPPEWRRDPDPQKSGQVVTRSVAALGAIAPELAVIDAPGTAEFMVRGGIIYALARTDIDDPHSRLHQRHAVGIKSVDAWHSVDPGKYSLAPSFAIEVADRIRLAN